MIHPSCRKGFSLFEMIVVMIIISLISALTLPQLVNSLASVSGKTAAKRVAAILRNARSRAVAEKKPYVSVFDLQENSVSIRTETPASDMVYRLPPDVRLNADASDTFRADSEIFEIVFFPNGSATGGIVTLTDGRNRRHGIFVDFITGSVRLAES